MADFVEVPDVAEFSVVQNLSGQNVINIFHIKKDGGWDSASMAAMCVTLISGYNDEYAPHMSDDLRFVIVRARDLSTQFGAVAEVNFPPNSGGDAAIQSAPGNVALCIKHSTGLAGRSFRGRTFLAGLPRTFVENNQVSEAYRDEMVAATDAIDGLINTAGGTWGVVSKYSGYTQSPPKYKKVPTPRAVGIFTDIINNSADVNVDSMRRRLNGRGS